MAKRISKLLVNGAVGQVGTVPTQGQFSTFVIRRRWINGPGCRPRPFAKRYGSGNVVDAGGLTLPECAR